VSDARTQILKLAEDRQRSGKAPLTDDEIIERHKSLRDGALIWLEQCVSYANAKGIKAAQDIYDHSTRCIQRLERRTRRR
jgi:hypothetical protein